MHAFVQSTTQRFHPKITTFCHFNSGRTTFSAKVHEFVQDIVLIQTSAPFDIFALGKLLFSSFQQSTWVCSTWVFSPKWARFVIFALGVPLFSEFQQSARVCTKQRFRRDVSTFCHFRTGHNTSYLFWAKCASFYKTAFSDRAQNLLSFSHWAQQFLAVFSKVLKFVQNSIFSPRSARFVTSALSAPLLSHF